MTARSRIIAGVALLAVACSPDTDRQQAPTREAGQSVRRLDAASDLDPVIAAAIDQAKQLESESPEDARRIYEEVLSRYSTIWCDGGPVSYRCGDEARSRLRILECLGKRDAAPSATTAAAFAASIVTALAANDLMALEAYAACDFSYGACNSDSGTNDVPASALPCLTRIAGTSVQLAPAPVASETSAWFPLLSSPALTLMLQRSDASAPWVWNGICFDVEDPCARE